MQAPSFSPPGSGHFLLGAAVWAAIGIPFWLAIYAGRASLPSLADRVTERRASTAPGAMLRRTEAIGGICGLQ